MARTDWLIDEDLTFLNHGCFGSCPRPVLEEQSRLREELERSPVHWLAPERSFEPRLDFARGRLAEVLGAEAKDVVFVPNATHGVNSVLRSFPLEAGDEIVFTAHGYNACNNAVRFACERVGGKAVAADVPFPLDRSGQVTQAILDTITENTKLVLVDHITSATGLVYPIEEIVREVHARGVQVLVDGAHVPGHLPVELRSLGADYYTGNCHKWLCAPKGCAFLHVREDHQEQVRALSIGHAANTPRPNRSRFQAEFDWPGTYDPTPYLSLPAAIDFLTSQHPDGLMGLARRNHDLVLEARTLLCSELGVDAPAPPSMIGCLAVFPLPDGPPPKHGVDELGMRLFEQHSIEAPVFHWPTPGRRWMRLSAQAYNSIDDYRALVRALHTLLR